MGTWFNTQTGPDGYRLQFSTENKGYFNLVQSAARHCVDGKPVLDLKPVTHGKWYYNMGNMVVCGACGKAPILSVKTNFCPNCGAKMDK